MGCEPDTPHELTLTRLTDWGECRAVCSVCGPLAGSFQSAPDAYLRHSRLGPALVVRAASTCRGVSMAT